MDGSCHTTALPCQRRNGSTRCIERQGRLGRWCRPGKQLVGCILLDAHQTSSGKFIHLSKHSYHFEASIQDWYLARLCERAFFAAFKALRSQVGQSLPLSSLPIVLILRRYTQPFSSALLPSEIMAGRGKACAQYILIPGTQLNSSVAGGLVTTRRADIRDVTELSYTSTIVWNSPWRKLPSITRSYTDSRVYAYNLTALFGWTTYRCGG